MSFASAEKNLEALKGILERLPSNACLCFVGDGPSRPELAKHFEGLPVYFTVRPAGLCACCSPCRSTPMHVNAHCADQTGSPKGMLLH